MLRGLDPLLNAELLHVLAAMGHGDMVAIVDANFPAAAVARRLVRMDGATTPRVLEAVLSVLPVDTFVAAPAAVMQVVGSPAQRPPVVVEIEALLALGAEQVARLERAAFYDLARSAFAVIATGERRFYGNVIVTKGVIPPDPA